MTQQLDETTAVNRLELPDLGYTAHDLQRSAESPEDRRHPFERDHDSVMHKPAFRRLQGKTQVVSPGQADFFRTRLTHTLEVAQIGHRLAQDLGVHPVAVEAAALLHDLGHPPFGHKGEQALCKAVDVVATEWELKTDDEDRVGGFEGNAQSFRLAVHSLSGGTMDLSRTVLDGAVKYPWGRGEHGPKSEKKWCFYPTEAAERAFVRDGLADDQMYRTSLESQVMDWADDVAYAVHDIEDWYKAGYMPLALLRASKEHRRYLSEQLVLAWRDNSATGSPKTNERLDRGPAEDRYTVAEVHNAVDDLFAASGDPSRDLTGAFSLFNRDYDGSEKAKGAIRHMRRVLYLLFTTPGEDLRLEFPADAAHPPRRYSNSLSVGRSARMVNEIIREMSKIYVVDHPRMATAEHGQEKIVLDLMRIHSEAAANNQLGIFPEDNRDAIRGVRRLNGTHEPELLRIVCDYVAGMTDSYASRIHGRLTGQSVGPFNEFV